MLQADFPSHHTTRVLLRAAGENVESSMMKTMRWRFLQAVLTGCVFWGTAARADPPSFKFHASGDELWTLSTNPAGSTAPVAKLELPAEIDSVLQLGQALYVVYAKKYIAVFDVTDPRRPAQREVLTADVEVQLLYPGSNQTLFVVSDGAAMAYSVADPLHPTPLLGSPALHRLGAEQEAERLQELRRLEVRKYRDYRVHPSIIAGIPVAVLGAIMMGVSLLPHHEKPPGETLDLTPLVTYPVAVSGGLHVLMGGGFLISGIYKQATDKRRQRPAAPATTP